MGKISFFDTLQGRIREFVPLDFKTVTLYTCGPTVYHYAHIGNFRTFVFEDLLRRFLEFQGYDVKHVMNITDVDDKTIAGAIREKKTLREYTAFYEAAFQEDMKSLNMLPPKIQPRATSSIPDIIALVKKLLAVDFAYVTEDGSVYYRIGRFEKYGRLSKKKLDGNIAGARVDVDEYEKEGGADFVLWKAAKEGEPFWDSPWGKGRPGWHIECSAMCMAHLGETVDIHAGGEDLVFPHHENEIAQSEAATGKPFVNYWLHAKHLMVDGEKMSKSKGNFFTLRDLLAKGHDPAAIRMALLAVHYRHPLNFTMEGVREAGEIVKKLDDCYWQCLSRCFFFDLPERTEGEVVYQGRIEDGMAVFLEEDLNVAGFLARVLEHVTWLNKHLPEMGSESLKGCLRFFESLDVLLGLDVAAVKLIPENLCVTLKNYAAARKIKDFPKSDRLRKEIEADGWLVKDGRPGEPSTLKKMRRAWDLKKS
ncbi:MAG: cysteine--tRNA ligase [Candidatus Omnitrophica bacterium]|nr:cysteine--tRNA ligase [Candidatus Omnitrophota bacterium]